MLIEEKSVISDGRKVFNNFSYVDLAIWAIKPVGLISHLMFEQPSSFIAAYDSILGRFLCIMAEGATFYNNKNMKNTLSSYTR